MKSGDFTFASSALQFVLDEHDDRSERAKAIDKAKRAPIATDAQRWDSDKSGVDFPGVDTPTENPDVMPKDLKQSEKPSLSARARNEAPVGPIGTERWESRQLPAEAQSFGGGIVAQDFEDEFENTRGQPVSSRRLPATVDLAEDREADMAFALSEEERKEKQRDNILDDLF